MQNNPCIRVLLVEDSLSDAELFGIYLEQVRSADYQVQIAETLADGVAVLKSRPVDIVLADLNLPDSFGIAVFDWCAFWMTGSRGGRSHQTRNTRSVNPTKCLSRPGRPRW